MLQALRLNERQGPPDARHLPGADLDLFPEPIRSEHVNIAVVEKDDHARTRRARLEERRNAAGAAPVPETIDLRPPPTYVVVKQRPNDSDRSERPAAQVTVTLISWGIAVIRRRTGATPQACWEISGAALSGARKTAPAST